MDVTKEFKIVLVEDEEQLNQFYTSRYDVFVREFKRDYPGQSTKNKMLIEPVDASSQKLAVYTQDHIVGGIRMTPVASAVKYDKQFLKKYNVDESVMNRSMYLSKLFIAKEYRRSRLSPFFFANIYLYLKSKGKDFIYLNKTQDSVGLYQQIGFKVVGENFFSAEVNDNVMPMMAHFDDDYLNRCRSRSYKNFIKSCSKK